MASAREGMRREKRKSSIWSRRGWVMGMMTLFGGLLSFGGRMTA
jgi:hypothetical protein